jgi:hypothetical protein
LLLFSCPFLSSPFFSFEFSKEKEERRGKQFGQVPVNFISVDRVK